MKNIGVYEAGDSFWTINDGEVMTWKVRPDLTEDEVAETKKLTVYRGMMLCIRHIACASPGLARSINIGAELESQGAVNNASDYIAWYKKQMWQLPCELCIAEDKERFVVLWGDFGERGYFEKHEADVLLRDHKEAKHSISADEFFEVTEDRKLTCLLCTWFVYYTDAKGSREAAEDMMYFHLHEKHGISR